MIKIEHIKSKLSITILAAVLCLGAPVLAHSGHEGGHNDKRQANQTTTTDQTSTETETETAELRKRGQALAAEKRQSKTAEQRQEACQSRKQGLTNKFTRLVNNAERANTRLDDFLKKTQDFKVANDITVVNYDELVAAAEAAGTAADEAITSLKAVKPSLDCNSVSVANDVATFKIAAQETRDALKAYKQAVKDVLLAVKQAAETDETEGDESGTTEGDQSGDSGGTSAGGTQ